MRLASLNLAIAMAIVCMISSPAAAGTVTISNSIYEVHVETSTQDPDSVGSWNAVTASGHPAGGGRDLLYSGMTVATNFSSLRIFGAGGSVTDYAFDYQGDGTAIGMDTLVTAEGSSSFSDYGRSTSWNLSPDSLRIVQDVFIVGSAFADSAIYYTVEITNNSQGARTIGWRNLFDWALTEGSSDDGPSNSIESAAGPTLLAETTSEFRRVPGADDYVLVSANPATPSYQVLLSLGYDPKLHSLSTTAPDEYAYADFELARATNFDYVIDPSLNITGDSAGLTWWGRTQGTATTLNSGESVRFTQALFAVAVATNPASTVPLPGAAWAGLGLLGILGLARRLRRRTLR